MRSPFKGWHGSSKFVNRVCFVALFAKMSGRSAKRRNAIDLVERSSLLDRDWYLQTYPDVAKSGLDPLHHYMEIGWREGRDPGPDFATSAYLRANEDVARSGINPLLHYVEFGHSEGRGAQDHLPILEDIEARNFEFADAAPCASFPIADEKPIEWLRSAQIVDPSRQIISIDGLAVGYGTASVASDMEAAAAFLTQLSGFGEGPVADAPTSHEQLIDAWFVKSACLRTRWAAGKDVFVVRAFQCDTMREGFVSLVGEGLAADPLACIDLQLTNPYFPILFAFVEPDGALRGARIMTFPSLCRGGAHHPELVVTSGKVSDPFMASDRLTTRLLRLLRGHQRPSTRRICVDLRGADGTGTLFQPDFREWLQRVPRLSLASLRGTIGSAGERYLANTLDEVKQKRVLDGGSLVIAGGMIPSIAALTEPLSSKAESLATVLLEGIGADEPAIIVEMPARVAPLLDRLAPAHLANWPRLNGSAHDRGVPHVIRRSAQSPLLDAELFTPLSGPDLEATFGRRRGITWLIDVSGKDSASLVQTLRTLALQKAADEDCVLLLGKADSSTISLSTQMFAGQVSQADTLRDAVAGVGTPLIGFVASGVMLHDQRTASLFSSLLDHEEVSTASCVMISSERRGKSWHTSIADAGTIEDATGKTLPASDAVRLASQLWRSNCPLAGPPHSLWAARKERVTGWHRAADSTDDRGWHMCTSMLTASLVEDPGPVAFAPPFSDRGIRAKLIYV